MIESRALSAGYGKRAVLQNVTCAFYSGKLTVLLGPNGCGKSTLLRTLAGSLPPLAGEVLLDGRPLKAYSPLQRARRLAYLPQSRNVPSMTALTMVLHARFPYMGYPRRYRAEDRRIALRALAEVGMETQSAAPLGDLSGGQRQKVYLAMLLAQETETVLLDEPTTYLDVSCQLDVWELCARMKRMNKTVVAVTHDLTMGLRYADELIALGGGGVAAAGTGGELLKNGTLESVFGVRLTRFGEYIGIEKREESK